MPPIAPPPEEYEKTNDMHTLPEGCDPMQFATSSSNLALDFNQTMPLQMPDFATDVTQVPPGLVDPPTTSNAPVTVGQGADPIVSCEMQIKTRMMEAMPDIDEDSDFRKESSLSTMSTSNFEPVPSQADAEVTSPDDPGATVITEIVQPFSKRGFSQFLDMLITKHFGVLVFLICTVIVLTAITVLAILLR